METYKVKVRGVRPLLVNRYPMEDQGKAKSRKGTVFNAEKDVKKALYKKADGTLYLPAEHFEGALIKGATQITMRGKKTFKDVVAQSIFVMPRELPLPSHYATWVTTGVIPATRGRVPIARPRWDEWEFEFDIQNVAPEDIDLPTMKNILIEAGKIGVGTFRLKFGKFEVVDIREKPSEVETPRIRGRPRRDIPGEGTIE